MMINESTEVVQKRGDGLGYDVKLEVSPTPKRKSQTLGNNNTILSPPVEPSPDQKRLSTGSPNSRRVLPSTPSCLSPKKQLGNTQEGNDNETLMRKFRYDTIARKKKESKNKQRNSSTFYLISDVQSDSTTMSTANSEPNLSAYCESPKLNFSPLFRKKSTSPLAKKKDSPQSKIKDNNLHNQTLKKKAPKINTAHTAEKQTHVALYKFLPRHKDELSFTDGDPIHVLKIYDDLWYEGINISTGKQGLFPCRYVADILAQEVDSTIDDPADHKQFHVRFLGSVEVQDHKGDEILMYAIARVVNQRSMLSSSNPPTCVLQISYTGVRICNMIYGTKAPPVQELERKTKKGKHSDVTLQVNEPADETHYFSLKNVTFCGNHPKDKRYFGFITKHPDEHRFACHVLMSKYSTDPIAKIFGECFDKFYANFMEYRASTEDIYLE